MRHLFYNPAEGRLRSGWRILLFLILFWCLASLSLLIKPLFGDLTKREYTETYSLLIVLILSFAATVTVWFARKYMDKRPFTSLGLKWSKRGGLDLLFGFGLSGTMAGLFLIMAWQSGLVEITGINWQASVTGSGHVDWMQSFTMVTVLLLLLEHILVAYWEELVFRGYLFQNLTAGLGMKPAILISCLLFGLIHYLNPNATLLSTAIICLFGLMRIYGYLATGMLWLSMGMHLGWNFFQGPVFGFSASGHQMATLLDLNILQPNWLSGGSFGPEGSLLIIPIVLLALWMMKLWSRRGEINFKEHTSITR